MPETIGIIAVRIPRGDLIDTLGEESPEGMIDIGSMTLLPDSSRETLGQPNLTVDPT